MRGQVAEYILVFAAVAMVAIIVLSLAFTEFPYAVFDTQAVVVGIAAGYEYSLSTFRDGAITTYSSEYNTASKSVSIRVDTAGWPLSDIRSAIGSVMAKYGYSVVWSK